MVQWVQQRSAAHSQCLLLQSCLGTFSCCSCCDDSECLIGSCNRTIRCPVSCIISGKTGTVGFLLLLIIRPQTDELGHGSRSSRWHTARVKAARETRERTTGGTAATQRVNAGPRLTMAHHPVTRKTPLAAAWFRAQSCPAAG